MDGVRGASILSNGIIEVIDFSSFRGAVDIFEDRSESDGLKDLRFFIKREVNGFSIASAFDIKDTVVGPAVFIIADESAIGVSAESCFTGS